MNVGTICYACHSGLGHLARDFFSHGAVSRILLIRHSRYQNYDGWYPDRAAYSRSETAGFLRGLDVLLIFENAFLWDVARVAKDSGIKLVLIPNYEYTPWPIKIEPDLVLCASLLDVDLFKEKYKTRFLPIPVDTERIRWRLRERALTFVHNPGHGGYDWREGTPWLVEAMRYVKSPIHLKIQLQCGEQRTRVDECKRWNVPGNVAIEILERPDEADLWREADVCVAPQRYNGMSLPLQEAFASGMLVMTTKRYPMTTWLPNDPMLPVKSTERHRGSLAREIERCVLDPKEIAAMIDEWYGKDISRFSRMGREWAERNSWSALGPEYLHLLESL
jgi:hypothetical protein